MSENRGIAMLLIGLLLMVLMVVGSVAWSVLQWIECRDMGHSLFYCIGHVVR